MLRILHLSDLHAGRPFLEVVSRALQRTAAELRPDLIAVSGDFTQRARRAEFRAARRFLDHLPRVPRVLVPGNHDVPLHRFWERLTRPHALYRRYLEPRLSTVLSAPRAVVVGLDSTDPLRSIRGGRVTEADLAFCERAFADAAPGVYRVIVVHHPLVLPPGAGGTRSLPGSVAALRAFDRLGVDLVLAGHLHRTYAVSPVDLRLGPDPADGVILVQCGTSTSRRSRGAEPNAFNWVELSPDAIAVTHYLYRGDGEDEGFHAESRHVFARGGRGTHRAGGEERRGR